MAVRTTQVIGSFSGPVPIYSGPVQTAPDLNARAGVTPTYTSTATGWTNAQLTDIQNAVRSGVAGVGGGETVGQIVQTSQAYLTKTGDFSAAQINAIGTAEAWDPHGLAFREQGSNTTPFYTAAYQAILSGFKGAYGTPHAAVQPPVVTPANPTPTPTPTPAIVVPATPTVTITAPPASVSASTGGASPELVQAIAALTALTSAFSAAVPAPVVAAPVAVPVMAAAPAAAPIAAISAADTAQTAATSASSTTADTLANAILANAQAANTAGSGSVGGGVAYPDNSGTTPLTATTSTKTGTSSTLTIAVLGLLGIGGLFVYMHFRGHKSAAPATH